MYAYGVLLMQIITGSSLLDSVDNMYIVQKVRVIAFLPDDEKHSLALEFVPLT